MRSVFLLCSIVLLVAGSGLCLAGDKADIDQHPTCTYCGMNRAKFAHSRMQIQYDDGSTLGTCSVHCAALDMALFIDKSPIHFGVGDYNTRKLVDATKAYWVIGGDKNGVMTKKAKWAFKNKADADKFIQTYGGKAADFEEVLKVTYADMYQDTKMIREKRKMMRQKKKMHKKE